MQLHNFFLSALKPSDRDALASHLSEVTLATNQVLYETGDGVDKVYFPRGACISRVTELSDGRTVESSTVGRESVVSLIDVLTGQPSRSRVYARIGGCAMRLPAAAFRAQLAVSPELLRLVLRHVSATALQAEQEGACNASHGAHLRLARWLLMTQDHVGASTFPLTQEYMAVMIGVQRSTVSRMAAALKESGIIAYSRGQLAILDRDALRRHACECYAVVGQQFEDLRNPRTYGINANLKDTGDYSEDANR